MKFYLTKNSSNALKITAALIVMLHHYAQYVCANGFSDSIIYKILSSQAGFFGVAIFFLLSGYGLMESESKTHLGFLLFLKKRVLKVYMPVICVTLLWMIVSPIFLNSSPFNALPIEIGGGNTLTISNIFTDFGDGVLWFVKVLAILYATFYIYSVIRILNQKVALVLLILFPVLTTQYVNHFMLPFEAISIPFFYLGIVISLIKTQKHSSSIVFLCLLVISILLVSIFDRPLAIHGLINVFAVSILIILFSVKQIDFRFPAVLGIISFDLYLVHNKVLMVLTDGNSYFSLLSFVAIAFILTYLFFGIRTKLLRI